MNAIRKSLQLKLSRSKPKDMSSIHTPLDSDILLGRSKASWNHVGNRKFRVFVGLHLKRYMEAATRLEKTMVVNAVVESVQQAGGRFLKLNKDGMWYVVSQKEAREKVGHALRDAVGLRIKLSSTEAPVSAPKSAQRRASNISMERRRSSIALVGSQMREPTKEEKERLATLSSNDFDAEEGEESDTLRKAREADQALDIDTNIVNFTNLDPDIPLTKLGMGRSSMIVCPITTPEVLMENLKDRSTLQRPKKKSDVLDSGEFSAMSVSRDMFDSAEGLSGEFSAMGDTASVRKWTDVGHSASGSFSVKSEVLDELDQTMARMVKEVDDRVEMQLSEEFTVTKSSRQYHHAGNITSSGRSLGKKHAIRFSLVDTDISEEFSVMSMSELKGEGVGEDARPKSAKVPPASRFAIYDTEIKPKAGWESEISEDFSSQGFSNPTRTSWTTSTMSDVSEDAASGKKVAALKTETNGRGRNLSSSVNSSITLDGKDFPPSEATFVMKDLEQAIHSPSLGADLERAMRQPSSNAYGMSEDFEAKMKASLSDMESSEEFGMPSPTPIRSTTAAAMNGLRASGRKKMLKLLSDVGEDDAEDASVGRSKHRQGAAYPVDVDKNENKNDGDNSEAFSVDTDREWTKTLQALAS
jgi:hypothetical protein